MDPGREGANALREVSLRKQWPFPKRFAAERLEVSEPTVRKWLAEGLLERVEDHKPVEIALIEVERVLRTIRESFPARRWSEAFAAFLHDRDLLGQEWAREGVTQLRHTELIER